jgi:hypothetical protein
MVNKYEIVSSVIKSSGEFRETVKIGSINSWDKIILDLFHIDFNKTDTSNLRDSNFIDKRYFDLSIEDE